MVEPEVQADLAVEDEPRYLRRQKPLEIRRRKFGQQAWKLYARVAGWTVAGMAGVWLVYEGTQFLRYSERVVLGDLERIELTGNRYVPRPLVLEKFAGDRGVSVVRVPLEARRAAIEEIPWVERATVRRVLPDGLRVEIVERTPVAFLRMNADLALVDADGVILERPLEGHFRFPVVTGISEMTPQEERRERTREYTRFLEEIELARPGATELVSEVDLSDGSDLRATLAGLGAGGDAAGEEAPGPVLVHFGEKSYGRKFRMLLDNLAEWRAKVGRVDSVDLRFENQVVVNPERPQPSAASAGASKEVRR